MTDVIRDRPRQVRVAVLKYLTFIDAPREEPPFARALVSGLDDRPAPQRIRRLTTDLDGRGTAVARLVTSDQRSFPQEGVVPDVSPKELARRTVEQLPDDATLEDAMEQLFLLEKIEQGRADVRAGRAVVHEKVIRLFGV